MRNALLLEGGAALTPTLYGSKGIRTGRLSPRSSFPPTTGGSGGIGPAHCLRCSKPAAGYWYRPGVPKAICRFSFTIKPLTVGAGKMNSCTSFSYHSPFPSFILSSFPHPFPSPLSHFLPLPLSLCLSFTHFFLPYFLSFLIYPIPLSPFLIPFLPLPPSLAPHPPSPPPSLSHSPTHSPSLLLPRRPLLSRVALPRPGRKVIQGAVSLSSSDYAVLSSFPSSPFLCPSSFFLCPFSSFPFLIHPLFTPLSSSCSSVDAVNM